MLQLSENKLTVTTEDELKARKEAMHCILERMHEVKLDFLDDIKAIRKDIDTLVGLQKQHTESIDNITKTIQATDDEHRKDMEELRASHRKFIDIEKVRYMQCMKEWCWLRDEI